jgi:hypothetical protein
MSTRYLQVGFILLLLLSTRTAHSQLHVVHPEGAKNRMAFQVTLTGAADTRVTVVPASGVGMGFLVTTAGLGEIISRGVRIEKPLLSMSYLMRVEYSMPGSDVWTNVPIRMLGTSDPTTRTYEARVTSSPQGPGSTALISIIMQEGGGPGTARDVAPAPGTPTIIQNFYDCCDCEDGRDKKRKPRDKSEMIEQSPIQQYYRD